MENNIYPFIQQHTHNIREPQISTTSN